MKELYKEVCEYIETHNNIGDSLYNGILLEVYNEYSYDYMEKERHNENNGKILTLQDLQNIANNVIDSDYFGETLTETLIEYIWDGIRKNREN